MRLKMAEVMNPNFKETRPACATSLFKNKGGVERWFNRGVLSGRHVDLGSRGAGGSAPPMTMKTSPTTVLTFEESPPTRWYLK